MPPAIAIGTFVLHSRAIPDLPAGSYTLHAEQSYTAPGATTSELDSHIEVTAPRFSLPANQVLSTFPPNKAQGSFSARLPQIVLKRRTLPWERELDGTLAAGNLPREIPWLALVLLADAECEFRSSRPIAECITAGVVLEGRNDVTIGDAIVVTQTVVQKVFPTKEELPLLAHVREVDLSDTELALGDDDGWLAVLLSNRLPQGGVRYRACLISLEGQYDLLPDTAEIEPHPPDAFATPYVYELAATATVNPPILATGRSHSVADAWSTNVVRNKDRRALGTLVASGATAAHIGEMHAVGSMAEVDPASPQYIFPVLANWQFTCTGDDDFQKLMQRLDVGMLDTVLRPPVRQRGQKPAPPRTRPVPQVIDTGHVTLSHVNRAGEPEAVWYRGPLVPHPGGRDMPNLAGKLPLLHSSDQARRIGPDGRENLSLAAAFEIGRLLALAEPSVVAAFLNWRKEGFEQARRMELAVGDAQLGRVDVREMMAGFAAHMGNLVLIDFGTDGAARFGDIRPPIDGGCPIAGLDGVDLVQLIAIGFGVPIDTVRELIEPGAERTDTLVVPAAGRPIDIAGIASRTVEELGHLRDAARVSITDRARGALAGRSAPGGQEDALDRLLDGRIS